MLPEKPLRAIPNRRIEVEAVSAVGAALATHPELVRLRRAIAQYALALSLWQPGHEIQCLAHLYMGVEALTKARLRQHLVAHALGEDELIVEWQIERKQLDAEVRRRLIFIEDQQAYAKVKAVSDGLEHGFSEYDEMQVPAREVVVRAAQYLRRAILDMLNLEGAVRERLLGADFNEPRGPVALVRYLRGTLSGPAKGLAMSDQLYPLMQWRGGIKSVTRGEDGKYSFATDEGFTAMLGQGVTFTAGTYEIWDGSSIKELPKHQQCPRPSQDVQLIATHHNARWRRWRWYIGAAAGGGGKSAA